MKNKQISCIKNKCNERKCNERRPAFTIGAFTLVELIVVITILAILGTIAFISLQGYSSQARDSKRLSDIQNIKKSLELFSLNSGKYPEPDDYFTVSYGSQDLRYQGTVGEQVSTNLSRNLNQKPVDPLTESEYVYSRTYAGTEYELLGIYESDLISSTSPQPSPTGEGARTSIVSSSYAANSNYPKISGTYNGVFVKAGSYIVPTPSIINALNVDLDLETETDGLLSQIITGGNNNIANAGFEAKTGGLDGMSLQVFSGALDKVGEDDDLKKQELLSKLQLAYTNTSLASDGIYKEILETQTTDTGNLITLIDNLVLNTTVYTSGGSNDGGATTPWCYYENTTFTDANGWTTSELKYDETTETCYVFGDENTNAINACNQWVVDNVSSSAGDFIWVPARYFITDGNGTGMNDATYEREVVYNENTYVCRGFAVAKYEMSYGTTTSNDSDGRETTEYSSSSNLTSTSGAYAIAEITQPQSITECSSIGTHLITNNEWMAIARNIEQQGTNWSNGAVGDGYIANGYSDDLTIGCDGNADGIRAEPTGSDCEGTNKNQLLLSNGTKIWDLAGNVREHVNKTNDITNTTGTNSTQTELTTTDNWIEWTNSGIDTTERGNYGPSISTYDYTNGIGGVYDNAVANNIFLRGGNSLSGPYTGIFALYLYWSSSNPGYRVGFRCVK